ncbi:DNA-processing protein DprA [uncultured Enterococcus sp.]|uniref:DNA-processing protein DprA n=1 Tax=uncultured Enterococcus sp. TaxID=167972 RepID=UPI002AA94B29|nr:DNA-processing protein DprA [uncultured Enterococcus sp.]
MEQEIRNLLFCLVNCQGIGNIGILKILQFILEKNYLDFTKEELIRIAGISTYEARFIHSWEQWQQSKEQLALFQEQHQFLTILDEEFPIYLKEIYNCPAVLFYRGDIGLLAKKSVSFVGARNASPYGYQVVREFIPPLVAEDVVVVSGLAKGIDSCCHEEAIKNKGKTIAVIGTGVDRCYPTEATFLHKKIAEEHLLLSEYPNGTAPKKHHFPMRNRIIAGLSSGTCLIEAGKKSGSLITAQAAMEYGREVFAVPGNIFLPHSEGGHILISQGAVCAFSPQDILNQIKFFY